MFGKQLVAGLAISIFMSLAAISQGGNLEVKQQGYLYQMPLTQNVYTETFVISPISQSATIEKKVEDQDPTSVTRFAHLTNPITIHFQIDSSKIDPGERCKMLFKLKAFEVPQNTPLMVTGFTCEIGPDHYNDWLSIERAKTVAELLQNKGYTVARIEGKGAANLLSKTYPPINRRVEIQVFKR